MKQTERVIDAVAELAEWSAGLTWAQVPERVQDRLRLVLLNTLGVTVAGGRLPDRKPLVAAWDPAPGYCPVLGAGVLTTPETAAWLNATAMVSLELDEGNKHAAGHPSAHGFPAVLALAAHRQADGPTTAAALLVAYEVAARFGRATRLHQGMHPHGSWGVAGGAAGCARLLGLDSTAMAAAIDTASGLPVAGHFDAALDGNPVRHEWMGASAVAGLAAARLAAAGCARNTGMAALSLGQLLGDFDPAELTVDLGARWDIELGYFKRHASCSFTHPAADAALLLREGLDLAQVRTVSVQTSSMAAGLRRTDVDTRLGAMFSIPFVTATALAHGVIDPGSYTAERFADPTLRALAARVTVTAAADLDQRLPQERAVRVIIGLRDGSELRCERPNPVGDADYHPYDEVGLSALLGTLLQSDRAFEKIQICAQELPAAASVRPLLVALAAP